MGVRKCQGTSEAKVIDITLAHRGTQGTQRACSTGFWITSYRVNFGGWVEIHTSILLEVDAGGHSTPFRIRAVSRGQEDIRVKQCAAAAPDKFPVGIIEDCQAHKGMFIILHKIPRNRIGGADSNRQD